MMDWDSFVGHEQQRQWFRNAVQHDRLASTFLMVGPSGIGKRTFARLVAKSLLCTGNDPKQFSPCGRCETCVQVEARTHPDVIAIAVEREKGKSALSIGQFIGDKEAPTHKGLIYQFRIKPYSGRCKIAIIDDIDTLAVEGANSLLKTLEEPPPGSVLFLIGTSEQKQLRTIRSRSQIVRFRPLSVEELSTLVLRQGMADNPTDANRIAWESHGSIEGAAQVIDEERNDFRTQLLQRLSAYPIDFPELAKSILKHLESAGADGQVRRDRLKWIMDAATDAYRTTMRRSLGVSGIQEDASLVPPELVERLETNALIALIQRTQQARDQVDRNVSPAALVEAWVAEVSCLSRA
ncbi:MAG: DNA polymerase III subunit [Planctomycetota bacterium]